MQMPYSEKMTKACPISRPWGVFNDATAQLMGCHASEDDAQEQIAALYASEDIQRAKYDGIDFTPPDGARKEAEKGLKWRKEYGRGGTPVGWARARDIANGVALSPETINRMVAFFSRHQGNESAEGWSPGEDGFPSNGRIAWALWGGDPGRTWANKVKNQMDSRDRTERMNSKQRNIARSIISNQKDGRVVIATETPIELFDADRNQVVRQILLMDGVQFRNEKNQLPIVDTHNDRTVRNVFGSIRNIVVEGDQLIGDPVFSSDPESQIVRTRFDEGHLNDFSIDATILARTFVQAGQTYTTKRGVVIEGPAEIVTAWEPHNASICATGADPNSTVRRSYELESRRSEMPPELMDRLMKLGLPEGMTDLEQITSWLLDHMEKTPEVEVELSKHDMKETMRADAASTMTAEDLKPVVAEEVARVLQAETKRRKAIQSDVSLAKLERSVADSLIDEGVSIEVARKRIIAMSANEPIGTSFGSVGNVRESGAERFQNAMRDAIVMRSARSARISRQDLIPKNADADDFIHLGLNRMAELVLRQQGINTDRMTNIDIAKVAMGYEEACRRHRVRRDVYHTTGSFQNILLDSVTKTLLAGYEEAPQTWSLWARQAPSVADFKTINRTRFSEAPDPEQVPERGEYKEKPMTDSKESYKVEKYGEIFSVSWETVVNDDLDAIGRVPAMHGNAHRRKVNRECYAVLAANPLMGDAQQLFSASHASGSNLSGSSGSPSVTNLNTAYAAMRTQKGLTADAILNVVPRYLIVPAALEATADELVSSTSYIVANGNSGVSNLYGPGGKRNLVVVCDPNLDGNSTTAWYLAADPGQIDTIEVSFLQGEESPVLESEWNFRRDAYEYKTRQTFGIKAIDWRGLYKFATS
jgi:hypothetical protein